MSSGFIEVTIRCGLDSGELLARLGDGEALGSWEKDGVVYVYWPQEKWSDLLFNDLKRALVSMQINDHEAYMTIRAIPDQDWNAAWAASLHPIRIGRRLRIRQSWNPQDSAFDGVELIIDPKRAFGTGHHATTQLLVEWLEKVIRGGERVLDIGTGSGILAMAAVRLGAASALGIDTDPVALECAKEYAEMNGFGVELELRMASFEDVNQEKFHVIVANLDNKTLPLLSAHLPDLLDVGGKACLSGLQQEDHEEVVRFLSQAGMRANTCTERNGWLALDVQAVVSGYSKL